MLNKKYASDLRPSMGPTTKKKGPTIEGSPEEASESPDEAHDEGDDMGDLFGEDAGDDEDAEPMDLTGASDDDILAEARKRGLSLQPPKKPGKSSYRSGADDAEADDDSITS